MDYILVFPQGGGFRFHFMPELLTQEEQQGGIQVDKASIPPQPADESGFTYDMSFDTTANVVIWVKRAIPKTHEEEIAQLKAENASLRQQVGQANADFTAFTDFYASKFPEQFL